MSQMTISRGGPGGRTRRSRAALSAGAVTATVATGAALLSGTAHAAVMPSVQLTFTPSTISAGTRPDLTFTSQDAPPGALFVLQESTDNGAHWKSVERTSNAAGSSYLPAAAAGISEYRVLMTHGSTVLAASSPAVLTVTGPGGALPLAPSPTATAAAAPTPPPTSAPPSGGLPWMEFIVKPIWDGIVGAIIAWIFSWL